MKTSTLEHVNLTEKWNLSPLHFSRLLLFSFLSVVAATAQPGDIVLDLGCGTGYLLHLLLAKRDDLRYVGVDLKEEALAEARDRFEPLVGAERAQFIQGNLDQLEDIALPWGLQDPDGGARFACTVLTFHDLSDDQKPVVLSWMLDHLRSDDAANSYLLLYDRLRLTYARSRACLPCPRTAAPSTARTSQRPECKNVHWNQTNILRTSFVPQRSELVPCAAGGMGTCRDNPWAADAHS